MTELAAVPAPVIPADVQRDVQAERILVNRYRKARKCAQVLLALGADAATADQLGSTEIGRALTAKAADCNTPSPTTWALVIELVREVRP